MKRDYGKVAVLMGGQSAEREISLRSGNAVLAALQRQGVDAHGVDPDTNVLRALQDGKFSRAFIALHGRFGEDGLIQGALETIGLPYTGTGVLGSALGIDKMRSNFVWKAAGVPVPDCVTLESGMDFDAVVKRLGLPIFVKPSREGSSFGITKVKRAHDMQVAYEAAAKYDKEVLAEQGIEGPETTCPVLNGRALPVVRIVPQTEFFDFEAKYKRNDTQFLCPSGLPEETERRIQEVALRAFRTLGCHGWGRVDVMLDKQGNPYVLEINTVPGMTNMSSTPRSAKQAGIEFDELVMRILETSNEPR